MQSTELLPLTEAEKRNKVAYLSDRDKILFSPLSFKDYSRIVSKDNQKLDLRHFYEKMGRDDGRGLTLTRSTMYEATPIHISTHPRYSYPILHNHDFVELIYVLSGSCINYINGQAINMKAGDFCFLAPSTVHSLLAVNDNDIIINILLWEESFSQNFPSLLGRDDKIAQFFKHISFSSASVPYIIFRTAKDNFILQLILDILEEFMSKQDYYIEMIGFKINEIFIKLGRYYSDTIQLGSEQTGEKNAYIYPIVSFIQMNYQTISLSELAATFAYSETYLSKLIKKNTGQTFKEIIENARIKMAKKLILTTNFSLTEISQKAGYFDSSHMNRDFIKRLGLPPKKWLRAVQKEN